MLSDLKLMTYVEIADTLRISPESARNLVRRKGWSRQHCEGGFSHISVPAGDLAQHAKKVIRYRDLNGIEPAPSTTDRKRIVAAMEEHVASLRAEIGRLSEMLSEQRSEHEQERRKATDLASELGAVRYILTEVTAERDAERARARQVEALNTILVLERKHAAELREDRDRWREAAGGRTSKR